MRPTQYGPSFNIPLVEKRCVSHATFNALPALLAHRRLDGAGSVEGGITPPLCGQHLQVVDLLPLGSNPHAYEPTPGDLKQIAEADIILASGKNLEHHLNKIRDNMSPQATLIEAESEIFVCCPAT